MRKEIGSHFEYNYRKEVINGQKKDVSWLPKGSDFAYTFSGRSAIELAIKDILNTRSVETVYMPSYCCDSMVQPFIKNKINVIYYLVSYSVNGISYKIDYNINCDIFFAMSYFGLEDTKMDSIIEKYSERGTIVIEDFTHRMLSNKSHSVLAHYGITSIRKWFAIPTGGFLYKKTGTLRFKPTLYSEYIIEDKVKAMINKYKYLHGEMNNKDSFLDGFSKFEEILKKEHIDYKIDSVSHNIINSINVEFIRNQRRANARKLYEGISDLAQIDFLISEPNLQKSCPLFVPIMMDNDKRNELRNYLIRYNVYCPVHWPQTKDVRSIIPQNELSLICDHRYTETDMEYIVNIIHQWSNDYK